MARRRSRKVLSQTLLPPEVWLLIFPYLAPQDLQSVTVTCSFLRFLAQPFLFSTLDVSPFLLSPTTGSTILRPKSCLKRFLKRIKVYQRPNLVYAVRQCWISPHPLTTDLPPRKQQGSLDPNLLVNAIIQALPVFPNLRSLSWHCVEFKLEWWKMLQSLPIKTLWLNSSSFSRPLGSPSLTPSITQLYLDQCPWKGSPAAYVYIREDGISRETLRSIIHPLSTELISVSRIETTCHVLHILSQKTYCIRSLTLPFLASLDDHFTAAIANCPKLESIFCFKPPYDRCQGSELEPFKPDVLPMLTSYEGPNSHVMQFAHQPLKQVKLWGCRGLVDRHIFCGFRSIGQDLAKTRIVETLISLHVDVLNVTAELLQVLPAFNRLERLIIQSRGDYYILKKGPVSITFFYTMMVNVTLPQTLKFLKFSTNLRSELGLSEQNYHATCFTELVARKHPQLRRLEISYGTYWSSMYDVVWTRIRENLDVEAVGNIDLSTLPKDIAQCCSSKSPNDSFGLSTILSTVHPLLLGKLTFTEHQRIYKPQSLEPASPGIWAMAWRKLRRLLLCHKGR